MAARDRIRRVLIAGVVLLAASACGDGVSGKRRPHIFLVTADALRSDHLSLNGYPRATSPQIDRFARGAVNFTNAVTVIPRTGPSFATIFTGRLPEEHGVRANLDVVPAAVPMLAERLRALGYGTAAFVGNPVLRSATGFTRGFDHYRIVDGRQKDGVQPVNDAFFEWARDRDWDQPVFVWIHYMDPAGPYTPPPSFASLFSDDAWAGSDERLPPAPAEQGPGPSRVLGTIPDYQVQGSEDRVAAYVARYDAEIRYMDTALGRLLAFVEEHDLLADSAVVFTADHGESLGEDGLYFDHGWFVHEGALRVPLMIKPPGRVAARTVTNQVSNLDLLPTLLAFAGSRAEEAVGANLLEPLGERPPLLIGNADRYPETYHGLRTERWKYLRREDDGTEWLFDLEADPGETRNLAASETQRLEELRRLCSEATQRARAAD